MEVVIKHDPYHKVTYMKVNGVDVMTAPVSAGYGKFKEQIKKENPIQTWLERRGNWKGILNELIPEESSDNLTFLFTGRKIDYEDLMHACESQNEERKSRCHLKFDLEYEITDEQTARNIEEVVKTLQSDRFKKLVDECNQLGFDKELGEKYKNFKADYDRARNAEFTITVAGIFSSGKSTIINSLMRHNALPVSYKTCTKKVCKIRDNPELKPNELNLLICDENKLLKKKACFSDADKAVNDKKCSELIESIKAESGDTILEANLGHLYPNEKSREMFKLVIVDTPGTDSNKAVNKEGINIDENTALNAVFDSKDEMVILSIKADDVDSGGLTRLIKAISNKFGGNKDGDKDSVGDSFVYNDRFLFVANKCDQIPFNHEETTTDFINRYRETLKNETKNPSFNPRIFPLCAAVPAYLYAGDKSESCEKAFYAFFDYIWGTDVGKGSRRHHTDPNPYYYFSQYCDIPQYKKNQYADKFNKIKECTENIKESDEDNSLLIQSGFVCLEDAIKDYIERFAYPRRIQRIQRTYKTIPVSVINCINAQETALKKVKESLETAQDEGKAAEEKEKDEKDKADKLAKAKSVIDVLKEEVDNCNYDEDGLYAASMNLDTNVYAICSPYMKEKMEYEKAKKVLDEIEKKVQSELNAYSNELQNLGEKYFEQINTLISRIESELEKLKQSEVFDFGGFDFSKSGTFSGGFDFSFDDFDFENYASYESKTIHNPEKDAYCSFWDLWGHIKKAFAKKTIVVTEHIVDMKAYLAKICGKIELGANNSREIICNSYRNHNLAVKSEITSMLESVDRELNITFNRISEHEERIKNNYASVDSLHDEIERIQHDVDWLKAFQNKTLRSITVEMKK